jgi:hypothetical protein
LIANITNATISKDIISPFLDRSVLIDADEAEFVLELKQKYTMTFVSINIYFVGVEHGVFETQELDKL